MLSFNRRPSQDNKKKSWDEAIRHYNLPSGGIEVSIPGDYKPKATKNIFKSAPVNVKIEKAQKRKPASKTTESADESPERSPKKPLRYIATRALFLTCGLATLGNIPVYSMVSAPKGSKIINLGEQGLDTDSPVQIMKELNLPAVAVESYSGYAVDALPDATQGNWSMRTVSADDTLESLLESLDLGKAAQILNKDATITQTLKQLKSGSRLLAQVVDGELQQLIYAKGDKEAYIISATDDGYVGKWEQDVFETRNSRVAFSIKHSVPKDGKAAGLGNSVIRQISQVFQKDMDFRKGVKVGDKIGVIFEDFLYQGESIYTDKILAAEYTNSKKTYQRIRFTLEEGKVGYFSPDGDTELKRTAFERKPLDGRMSSGFGMRRHPVFGLRKNHAGVDFAAPRGTPIHATADGNVKFIGRQGGYGNVVELRHTADITTLYGHMSGFKEGMNSGDAVKRGDVIGYVGSTGTSTGNHVHYEYRINGEQQNPMTVELPKVGIMSETEMREFKAFAANMTQQLADLRKVATADKPESDNKGG